MAKTSSAKKYNHKALEKKWRPVLKETTFRAKDFSKRKKLYCLVEFPYPSGSGLHVGHAFTFCLMDIFARKKRQEGYNVLYPMGWDAFGLPAENAALKEKTHPRKIVSRNIKNFRKQMDRLALAYNWEREVNTTDPEYYKWTQYIFLQLFKHGLAYKKESEINWCPSCKTALANEEVIQGLCERCDTPTEKKILPQWFLRITKYADRLIKDLDLVDWPEHIKTAQKEWIGRSEGWKVRFPVQNTKEYIEIFTSRLDTIFGVSFMAVAPEHPVLDKIVPEYKKKELEKYREEVQRKLAKERLAERKQRKGLFLDVYCVHPILGHLIPVFATEFVIYGYGTGAIMGVPAHDKRDYAFAQHHQLPVIEVIKPQDPSPLPYTGEGILINSGEFSGLKSSEAREKIGKWLEKRGLGTKSIQYNLRDWMFSRQRYWGEPIPMIFCEDCAKKGISWWNSRLARGFKPLFDPPSNMEGWFPEENLPLKLPNVERYEPTGTGESPLAKIEKWVKTKCPNCKKRAYRETITMPQWAGSSWYYLRYTDPHNQRALADKKKLRYWLPVDIYFGGAEHVTLHLLYSRFWHKFLYDIKIVPTPEPYQLRLNHGLILGEDGKKMSKSKGNVVNPDEMVEKYGTDSVRTYIAFIGPYYGTFPWQTSGIEGVRRFLSRVYIWAQKVTKENKKKRARTPSNVKKKLEETIKGVSDDIDNFKFNTAVAKLMEFINLAEETIISLSDLKRFSLLLSPFAPYLSQELWQMTGEKGRVDEQRWPKAQSKYLQQEKVKIIVQVNGRVRDIIEVKRGSSQKEVEKIALSSHKIQKYTAGKKIKTVFVPDRVINLIAS